MHLISNDIHICVIPYLDEQSLYKKESIFKINKMPFQILQMSIEVLINTLFDVRN